VARGDGGGRAGGRGPLRRREMKAGRGKMAAVAAGCLALAVAGVLASRWREIEARWLLWRLEGIRTEEEARPVLERLIDRARDPAVARNVAGLLGPGRQFGTFWVFLGIDEAQRDPTLPGLVEERMASDRTIASWWRTFCLWREPLLGERAPTRERPDLVDPKMAFTPWEEIERVPLPFPVWSGPVPEIVPKPLIYPVPEPR